MGGFLSSKRNRTFYTLAAGNAFVLLGTGLLYTVGFNKKIPNSLYGYEVLVGFGFGLLFSSATVVIKIHASAKDAGMAIQATVSRHYARLTFAHSLSTRSCLAVSDPRR